MPGKKPKKKAAAKKPRVVRVSGAAVGRHLDLTPQRVGQLADEGVLARGADGKFDLDEARLAYIRWVRDETRKSSASQTSSALAVARTREVELRIAREEGAVIDLEDVQFAVAEIVGAFVSELAGLSAACTRDLELRRSIEKHVNGAIDRCRERFEKAERNNFDSSESAVEEDDAAA